MDTGKKRYELLDTLRGLALVNMVLYHLLYDLRYVVGLPLFWFEGTGAYWWQQAIVWSFVLLSGFCWNLGRRKCKRGITVWLAGLVITGVTWTLMPSERIFFGVLSFMGSAMLVMVGADRILRRVPPILGMGSSLVLFALTRHMAAGYLGLQGRPLIWLPDGLYANYATAALGFPFPGFYSSDYVPFFPAFFFFTAGYYLWKQLSREGRLPAVFTKGVPLLSCLGRHSLILYMGHQVVIMGILQALMYLGWL